MKRWLLPCLVVLAIAGCGPDHIAEFWRPISEPNLLMPLEKAQRKLDFDLSQCKCGIYPNNISHNDAYQFQPDKQQLVATGVDTTASDDEEQCMERPSLIVSECMRSRGWEVTNCSGRMPLPGGGSLCAAYKLDN